VARSPEYGLGRSGAPNLTGGGTKEREDHADLGSGLTGSSVGRGSSAREEKRGVGEVWGAPGVVRVAFIGPEEGAGGLSE
jgi:hypothetical protein